MAQHRFCAIIVALVGFLAAPQLAAAPRVALVVGNGAYEKTEPLANPGNDARAMAAALRRLQFKVFEGIDLDRRGVERLLRDFAREADAAEAALFFYAGHGLEVAGKNYIVPVDAELTHPGDLPFETVDLDAVVAAMGSAARTNLVFVDACRNNPLARQLARGVGKDRSLEETLNRR